MKASAVPTKIQIPFGSGPNAVSYMRTVPVPSQQGITNGAASFTDGFPPVCFQPIGSGGVPPAGQDFQYLLYLATAWNQWQAAGGLVPFDATFSAQIGGYPSGATVTSAVTPGRVWVSTVDNNTTNPDSGTSANWLALMQASDVLALIKTNAPVPVTGDVTIHVSTSGSDMNGDGTSAKPFATVAYAAAFASRRYFFAGYRLIVQLDVPGTYAAPGSLPAIGGQLVLQGDPNNPSNYILSGAGPTGGNQGVIGALSGCNSLLNGLTVSNTGTINNTIYTFSGGSVTVTNCNVTSTSANTRFSHFSATGNGAISLGQGLTISGGMATCLLASSNGSITIGLGIFITVTGSPTFGRAFAVAAINSSISSAGQNGFTGAASGPRYLATANGVISTGGAGPNYFPGSTAGSQDTGGQYV